MVTNFKVKALDTYDFSDTDLCLMSAGGSISKEYAPKIAAAGCVVIDNSSTWRYDSNIPLIVPEVNAQAIDQFSKRNIIANPNCSTIQLVLALKPLHEAACIKRVVVSTYQSVSGAGKEGMDELFEQSRAVLLQIQSHQKNLPNALPSTLFPISMSSWKMGIQKKNGKWPLRQRRFLILRSN